MRAVRVRVKVRVRFEVRMCCTPLGVRVRVRGGEVVPHTHIYT